MSNDPHFSTDAAFREPGDRPTRSLVQIHPLDLRRGPIELSADRTTIGRSHRSDLCLVDVSISREHAEIRVTDKGVMILDLGSTNGLAVNGTPAQSHYLSSGDCIQLGSHVFRFLADDDLESQYHAVMYSMMTRDGLTGALTKSYLDETLQREVARCKRHVRPLALIQVELDQLQAINESYGEFIGEQTLRELSARLQNVLRADDVLARDGVAGFTVLMVETDFEDAVDVAERCRLAVQSEPVCTTIGPQRITISLGVTAPKVCDMGTSEELITESHERLCEAKSAGRNRTMC